MSASVDQPYHAEAPLQPVAGIENAVQRVFCSVHLLMSTPRRGVAHCVGLWPAPQHSTCPCLQVGDTVTVHLRSRVHFPLNFVPTGLLGTAANQAQVVAPGRNATYTFAVPAEVLPSHTLELPNCSRLGVSSGWPRRYIPAMFCRTVMLCCGYPAEQAVHVSMRLFV